MREPYRTLFEGQDDHWLFSHYILGDEPDWDGLLSDQRLEGLSSGEKALLDMACWFAGPRRYLDDTNMRRVARAFLVACEAQ